MLLPEATNMNKIAIVLHEAADNLDTKIEYLPGIEGNVTHCGVSSH